MTPPSASKSAAHLLLVFALAPAVLCFYVVRSFGPITFPGLEPATIAFIFAFYTLSAGVAATLLLRRGRYVEQTQLGLVPTYVVYILVSLSAIYVALSVYDTVFSRQILELGIAGARRHAMAVGPRNSAIGAINLLLTGAPVVLASIALVQPMTTRLYGVVGALFVLSFASTILAGGRNPIAISAVYIVATGAIAFARDPRRLLKNKQAMRIIAVVASAGLFIGVAYVLWSATERAIDRHSSIAESLAYFSENYKVEFTVPTWLPSSFQGAYYGAMNIVFYLAHPIVYLDDYFATSYCPATLGSQSFDIVFRAVDVIFRTSFIQASTNAMVLPGIYLSLPGTLYLDFCWFAPIAGALIAAASAVVLIHAMRSVAAIPMAAYALTLLALSPLYSVFTASNGFSLLVLSLGTWAASGLHRSRGAAELKAR